MRQASTSISFGRKVLLKTHCLNQKLNNKNLNFGNSFSTFRDSYLKALNDRSSIGIAPQPINAAQAAEIVELLKSPPAGEEDFLLDLISNRVPPGVDEAAYVKAGFLTALAKGDVKSPILNAQKATQLLGTMQGGYNINSLVELLDHPTLAPVAAAGLKNTLLLFESFHDVEAKSLAGNKVAKEVIESWAKAEWFLTRPEVPKKMTVTVFKVPGETNTDDLSPGSFVVYSAA